MRLPRVFWADAFVNVFANVFRDVFESLRILGDVSRDFLQGVVVCAGMSSGVCLWERLCSCFRVMSSGMMFGRGLG